LKLFGFNIIRDNPSEKIPSIAPKIKDDGAVTISSPGPLSTGVYMDLESTVKNEAELVTKYRDMSGHPELDAAIDEIVNEAIVTVEGEKTVSIILDDIPIPPKIKEMITAEFDEVLKLLEFNTFSYDVFKKWYIDGRLYYLILLDPKNPVGGIMELRFLDPRKIRKIRQVKQLRDKKMAVPLTKIDSEYYIYTDKSLISGPTAQLQNFTTTTTGVKIAKDSIVHVTSGLTNSASTMVLSYLHKAIKPLNMLRSMEDSCVIYRVSRAPERRIFYIDVGNLPHMKAEQYVKSIMDKHKNKLVYNAETGELSDNRRIMTMLDDYYIPRKEGGKTTQIDTLPAGQNLGQIEDIKYFQNKLYNSLNVPISRLNPEYAFDIGRATQISRDEVKFSKFIDRLRSRFNTLFLDVLEKNLVLKRILTPEEWQQISYHIRFKYLRDNCFSELKDQELMTARFNLLMMADPYIGKYISHNDARVNILKQTETDIEKNDEEIQEELSNPQFMSPEELMGMAPSGGLPPPGPQKSIPKSKNKK
jgi:hypothetical protein